ncbi:MAG: helix-turn-helix domain-containing protein [Tannerella sp.]|jgi:hypothetical protein|nr:helix-turn-helix domain-containing protein [Tannerella sp.]
MVERIKKRFVENGLDSALEDKPAEREYTKKADGDLEARLIALRQYKEITDTFMEIY